MLAPAVAAVDEALYFHGRLRAAAVPLGGFVANRVQRPPGLDEAAAIEAALRARPETARAPRVRPSPTRRRGWRRSVGRSGRSTPPSGASSRAWRRAAPGTPITEVPLLDHDVDNLEELRVVGDHLWAAGP